MAEATATTLARPTLAPIRPLTDQTIHDPVNRFSLKLLPGWYASLPTAGAVAGTTVILNYDGEKVSIRLGTPPPPNWLKIQIGAGQLKPGQSFEQWLSDRIASETTSSDYGGIITATEPSPYNLGKYKGASFVLTEGSTRIQEIALLHEGQIIDIGLMPADSPALSEALSMLSSIEISSASLP